MYLTQSNEYREKLAIETYVGMIGGSYQKIDSCYKIYDSTGDLIAYADVVIRYRTIRNSYPLPIVARNLIKVLDKRLSPMVIWSCEDGILYGKIEDLSGSIIYDGDDYVVYFDKTKKIKYLRN